MMPERSVRGQPLAVPKDALASIAPGTPYATQEDHSRLIVRYRTKFTIEQVRAVMFHLVMNVVTLPFALAFVGVLIVWIRIVLRDIRV
jgi:hypothetical protein